MTVKYFKQITSGKVPDNQAVCECGFVDESGNVKPIGGGSSVGNATTETAGIVKQATTVATVASADAAAAAAETVTKAEFDAVVAVANECKQQLNAALAALKTAGSMA